jgi:twitching motility protein PilT
MDIATHGLAKGAAEPTMDLKEILRSMLQHEASDLHLKVGAPPVVRLLGQLIPMDHPTLSREDMDEVVVQLTSPEQRAQFERERELDFAVGVPQLGRFRVNLGMQRGTPTGTLRSIPVSVKSLTALHLPPIVGALALRQRGIILLTGITGSGKSTTLAAMVEHINANRRLKIVTIEDPIEFLIRDNKSFVMQREVGVDTADYASGLRHVLRQDPDVLMVGEIRDVESMDIALKAANTGHLVFATLHTTDAVQTLQRIMTFFPPERGQEVRSLLAENLQGVVSLRLIRTADGKGRVPACEVMVATEAIRDFLHSGERPSKIAELIAEGGVQYGMQTFDQSLMHLYQEGQIDQEEALANATNRSEFALKLRGIEGTSGRVWVDA